MTARKIVLHCPDGHRARLDALVEGWIRDGVRYVGVVGLDAARIEDIIDEIVVMLGIRQGRPDTEDCFLLTASHADETLAEALDLAVRLDVEEYGHTVQLVTL